MRTFVLLSSCWMLGCAAKGSLQVFVAAEDTITEGLTAGTGPENIADGWNVTYTKFLVTVGNFRAHRSANDADSVSDPTVDVLDMQTIPASGFTLTQFSDLTPERWDKAGYDLPNASPMSGRADNTAVGDYERMIKNGYSLYFEATLEKPGGQSCKPTSPSDCVPRESLIIRWGVRAGTAFDDCGPSQGDTGFAVPSGGTAQVTPTIHGDHWFFTDITQGGEQTQRRAQWIADCDLDRNGETTIEELKMVFASDVFGSGYNLTGALIPISTAYDYLEAQARTLGDFQGDGECPTRKKL